MSLIKLDNVSIAFPVYNANARSLKKKMFQIATGGRIASGADGRVVIEALSGLNMSFSDGDRVGLLGHNGAGKSTFLRLLGGIYHPTSGLISVEGKVGSLIDISLGIDPEATGRENVYIRGALLGMTRREIESRFDEIVEFSELGEFIDMPLRTYSTGMHMRLAFTISTIIRPDILLMDEWLSVGDEGFKHKAEERMKSLVEATRILVLASHSKDLILSVCNKVIWLEHGKVKLEGLPEDVCRHYFDR
ncbi:ABC transporter ATP-binding protein [Kluyvera genomosp. 2]|uniref:ABC transporter ATP-binding protein n=1 Tax=Kluyvera genomosp. 2 TaxID=2774054 RepID=UPI002FD7B657